MIRYGLMLAALCGVLWAAETETRELAGQVRCPNNNPVAGAQVTFYAVSQDAVSQGYAVTELGKTQTDSLGQYTFPMEEDAGSQIICLVRQEGFSCGWANYYSLTDEPTIQLTVSSVMSGVVKDAGGQPVAGAEVRLFFLCIPGEMPCVMIGVEPVELFAAVTDEQGRFEFIGLPETATAEILVKKAGMGTLLTLRDTSGLENGFTYKAGQTDIELAMAAGCTLTGRVEDAEGTPVAGILVHLTAPSIPVNLLGLSAMSGEDGTFRLADLAPGSYKLTALNDQWVAEPVELEVQGETTATVKLSKGGVLEVTVVDGETGETVAGASVTIRREGADRSEGVATAEDGIGRKQVPAGRYTLGAYKQGYKFIPGDTTVDVEDGKTAAVTIKLKGQSKLTGMVLDPDGKPVEGAQVQVFLLHGESAKTDADGKFHLRWDPARMPSIEGDYQLIVFHQERNLAWVEPFGADAAPLTMRLEKGGTARGRVVDPGGKPIAGARAMVYLYASGFGSSFGMEDRTNEEGFYDFACLPTGHRLSLDISDAKGYGSDSKEISPDSGQPLTVEDIVLQVADQRVTGQAVDVDGKPLEKVQIHAYGSGQPSLNTTTDAEGRFVLEPVCAGEVRISANYQDGSTWLHGSVQTEGGAQDVTLVIGGRNGSQFVPRKAVSLVGKGLGEALAAGGVELPAEPNAAALFVWDINQRPSRHFAQVFAQKAALLKEKGITAVLLQAGPTERSALDAWLSENGIDCPCGMLTGNTEEAKFKLGVQGLPWLIITDGEGKVTAEGVSVDELDAKLSSL